MPTDIDGRETVPTDGTRLHIIIVSGASVHRRFVDIFQAENALAKGEL